jgi:hypothetical protein
MYKITKEKHLFDACFDLQFRSDKKLQSSWLGAIHLMKRNIGGGMDNLGWGSMSTE